MNHSVLFFCGQPLASRPISQRIAAFGAFLAKRGWEVRLTAVAPEFGGEPFVVRDAYTGLDVEVVGVTHYRFAADGQRIQLSPGAYLGECRKTTARIAQSAQAMGAEYLVLSTTLPASLVAVAALRSKHPQVWIDVDDWSAGQFTARGGAQLVGTVYGMMERILPRFARRITVCSKELKELFPKAELIPNFIRLEDVPARNANPARADRVRVAFASSVTAYHGHIPFLEALAKSRAECSGLEVCILGDGDSMHACRETVNRGGLSDIVSFSGQLDRAAMLQRLTQSEIGVLPLWDNRLNRARFPLKLLDCLACGCAIAASNVGMAREILSQGKTAMLSEAGNMDALIQNVLLLAKDPGLRARMSLEGMALARNYSESAVCERWMRLMSGSLRP